MSYSNNLLNWANRANCGIS